MDMEVLENFVLELIKNDYIKDYKSDKNVIKNFYDNQYKSKTGLGLTFHEFTGDLYYCWYIKSIKNNSIVFDKAWINYFKQVKPKVNPEEKVVDKNGCQLCAVKFRNEDLYNAHLKDEEHTVRVQYLQNKDTFFTKSNELYLNDSKLVLEPKTNIKQTVTIRNNAAVQFSISRIIQINLSNADLIIDVPKSGISLKLKIQQRRILILNGYFENSTSFVFPIVIVANKQNSNENLYFLKEIPIEVKSEYSDLDSGIPYVKKTPVAISSEDTIVPGEEVERAPSHYKEIIKLKPHKIPTWFQQKLNDLMKKYPNFIERSPATPNVTANFFFKKFSQELGTTEKLNENNYCKLFKTLIDIEENQQQYDIRAYDDVKKLKRIHGNIYELEVPGLAEARPSLLVHDSVFVKRNPKETTKYQGIVHKVLLNAVHLGFNKSFSSIFMENMKFHVEFGYNRRSIKVDKQALELVTQHEVVSYFYPKIEEIDKENIQSNNLKIRFFNGLLNEEQKTAVRNILVPKSAPYLVFGPPGTGKTVTIVEAVLQIWKNQPTSRIIVCAPSNAATDEIAIRLVDKIPASQILRLYGRYGGLSASLEKIQKISNLQANGDYVMPSMETMLKNRVLVTTIVTAARLVNGGVPRGHYTHVLIDESGYVTEAENLAPIAGILSSAEDKGKMNGQIVLAGDPRQLGPIIHSEFARYCGYDISMLERLLDTCPLYARNERNATPYNPKYITKLIKNYRSHEKILKIPNQLFYDNELQAADMEMSNIFTDSEHLKVKNFPVIFHNVQGEDKREKNSPSFFNTQEIEQVMNYLQKLVKTRVNGMEITQDHIGIVTPYRKQAELLRKACKKKSWDDILVGSVEYFQGKEKLIIIVSTVRSKDAHKFEDIDKKCQLGFLRNPKRFNVALTRAKALLVVIGNADVLKTDKSWCSFLQYCLDNKSVCGKVFNIDTPEE